jgi:hypothetical protein
MNNLLEGRSDFVVPGLKTFSLIASAFTIAALVTLPGPKAHAEETFFTIGTGGVAGVYYPTGGAICRLVNKQRKIYGIRCSVESTNGSIANIEGIRDGDLEIGVVQSDWQYHAYNGTNKFKDKGPFKELRSLFSVHPEPFTVVARANSGIKTLDDLKGKRVNIGNPGSGQRGTMEVVMAAKGWTTADFSQASELTSTEQSEALCADKIDAMVFTVGHPSSSIQEATTACDSVIVEVSGPEIDKLVADNPYYRHAVIPGGMYKNNPEDVKTFGVGATVVSSTRTSPEIVYAVVKSVFDNLDQFKKLHPALANLKREEMIKDGLSAPLHDGAVKYYKEAGLM